MLINKWLITDSLEGVRARNNNSSICLHLYEEPRDLSSLYTLLQQLPHNSFSLLLSGEDGSFRGVSESFVEKIIGIFFQPCYHLYNFQPVLFFIKPSSDVLNVCRALSEKCKRQGFQMLPQEVQNTDSHIMQESSLCRLVSAEWNYESIVKNWLSQYLENKNPGEVHLFILDNDPDCSEVFEKIQFTESQISEMEDYKIARLFYEKETLIAAYKHQLELSSAGEKDAQLYLAIQKDQTMRNVMWYHQEYEILPAWYKRFGHIIKVLMGKRTVRSLFSDNAKKSKD